MWKFPISTGEKKEEDAHRFSNSQFSMYSLTVALCADGKVGSQVDTITDCHSRYFYFIVRIFDIGKYVRLNRIQFYSN